MLKRIAVIGAAGTYQDLTRAAKKAGVQLTAMSAGDSYKERLHH